MNYTYMKKLKNYIDKSNDEITKEIFDVSTKAVTCKWGFTKASKKYIRLLKFFKLFNRIRLKKMKSILYNLVYLKFNKKIRVMFIVNELSVFPSFKSVYDTMIKDKDFICDLVYVPFIHANKALNVDKEMGEYIEKGYKEIISYDKYQLSKKSPDIVFYLKPYDSIPKEYYIDEIEKVVEKVVFIPYAINTVTDKETFRYAYGLPISNKAWIFVSHCKRDRDNAIKYSYNKGENIVVIGHPRMDLVNVDYSNDPFYKEIEKKAKGRKIFLYDPHHTVNESYKWGTFKIYGLDILKYFNEHKDVFLVYRPHPLLKLALEKEFGKNSSFMKEYNKLLKSENIIYDTTGDYLISMHISDYLICDANSFLSEFVMYKKPVIYTMFPNCKKIDDKDLESMIYIGKNIKEIYKYMDNLRNGKDKLKTIRDEKVESYFYYDENKTVAEKLIDIIKKEYRG